jgi:hypothetical protein
LIPVTKVLIKVLSPKINLFIFVVEYGYARAPEIIRHLIYVTTILARERERYIVLHLKSINGSPEILCIPCSRL